MLIRLLAALALSISLTMPAGAARITFVLVNDIYRMSDAPGADGKARGGFARLAAVVKAERARGNPVVFAHAGDTLSPSLMSGLDRGAHIIALTNMIRPDIFVPGNHEFDFGKAVFLQRMAEARFPLYAANLRGPDGRPLPGFRDEAIVAIEGIKIGLVGATYDDSARASNPEDLKLLPTVETIKERAAALKREGADFVVAVAHATRAQDRDIVGARSVDLLLTGHEHDLVIAYDGRNAHVESSYDAQYVVAIDVDIDIRRQDGRREVVWWPNFRVIDTATVTPDPEVAAAVRGYEQDLTREMDVPLATTAVELDSRNMTVRSREAAIGDLIADAMRAATGAEVAIMNGGGIRSGRVYAPGTPITRRDVLAELPFGNRTALLRVSGRDLRAALENGFGVLPQGGGRFPQVSGLTVEIDGSRPPGSRIVAIKVAGAPLDDARTYTLATNDFLASGRDGYVQFRDAERVLPDDDAPLLANEVMVHLRKLGTVRTGADGRIVIK
ncbi:MAG TPA: bifunctional UDP-sugar hydrolase/5'-nucleotidase [Xanthobacteraceae bacterium]|nr:bifunctional UDP-sugar hydrolase/5'-nucleotidase [Xanthobacteraceae bacterium]